MVNTSNGDVLTFNGEIYNYLELRDELIACGHRFRTKSDSEIALHLYEDYGEELPSVVVNPEEIQQVILNLILNAEQAMRTAHRGGTLTVTTKCVDAMVMIEIQDDGPGVPAALAGRVFEPFFSTKEVGEGTGLGLSIAMGIAEAHAGTLTLVPTDRGACFRLALPAVDLNDRLPVASLVSAAQRS
jgi:signal transduction histidine kinase